MKLEKINNQLEKIENLLKSIKKGGNDISAVEKGLLQSYIQKLYEYTLDTKAGKNETPSVKRKKTKSKEKKIDIIKIEPKQQITEPQQSSADPPEPVIDQNPEPILEMKSEPGAESEEVEIQSPSLHIPEEVNDLFTHKKAVELSEKLGEAPIEDLTKAMGINEKIFTIQELFGGKQQFFNDTLDTLNSFSKFEDAKDFLIKNVAVDYNWGDNNRKKKAGNFIKLIRRRYQ